LAVVGTSGNAELRIADVSASLDGAGADVRQHERTSPTIIRMWPPSAVN